MVKRKELFIFLLLLILSIFFIYIYKDIKMTKKDIYDRIEKHQIRQISDIIKNIQDDLMDNFNITNAEDMVLTFKDKKNRQRYENIISLIMTSNIKYAYILYRDDKEKFRFILDASKTDKANFYQKFDTHSSKYMDAYETKRPQIIKQKDVENLYITYLYPIVKNDEVIALFNVDITTKIQKSILRSIEPLETFFIVLIIFILLLMLMSIMQISHYFLTRKRIFTDSLTKTFNRNYLEEMSSLINLGHYSLAMLDLDKFKIINDTYGHKAGDHVLSQASGIFKSCIRDSDILVRYGGEEFLLLINNRRDGESTLNICERLKSSINKERFFYDANEIQVTVSIGLHNHPYLEKNLQEAIKKADEMLYLAKRNGRNRVEVYDEKELNNIGILSKNISFVKEAMDENRVVCYYQPIYDHVNEKIYKYEALVRIITQDGAIIGPYEFMPYIKDTNIHYKLTKMILQIVFDEIKNSQKNISVNINFSDLMNQDIEDTIIEHLTNNPDLAGKTTFEILESSEVYDVELFKAKTKMLHSLGAKVSIDDFGSGYSNFKTVIDIEANYLKIDGSLIKNIDVNEKDYKVVKSIIHFAAQSDMKTIAEFVHSKEVFHKLAQLHVDYMQGFFISPPKATLIDEKQLF